VSDRRIIDCDALMTQAVRTPGLLRVVQRWCRLNGIDPGDVPVPSEMVIEDSAYGPVVRYEAYLTTGDGRRYLDPKNPNQAAREARTAVLTVAPPAEWLNSQEGES